MTTKPYEMWFWCRSCDIEFQDPYAEEHDGRVYAECECGRTLDRPVPEADA